MDLSLPPSPVAPFPLGIRCVKCHRYLVRGSRAKRSLSGKWRHESCQHVTQPSEAEFVELAAALMRIQPWPRLQSLATQAADAEAELAVLQSRVRAVPEQRSSAEGAGPTRQQLLQERVESLRAAIDDERTWKAGRLATEWADGH